MISRAHFIVIGLTTFVTVVRANAAEIVYGEWARDDGQIRTQIGPCGENICAINTWAKNPRGDEKVGDKLVMTLKKTNGERWEGAAFDPQRNRRYSMELSVSGNRMTSQGCILGGILCRNVGWSRFGS